MRILILSQWYPPEPALLIQELAQTLQEFGHEVSVLTGFPNYPTGQLYPGYRIRLYQREVLNGVPVVRVPLYADHSRSGIRRAANYLSFAFSSALLGPWLQKKPDVMFVYHPPLTVGIPAFLLSRLWRVPFVYQVQDLWPETLQATGMINHSQILEGIGQFAQWVYARAHSILVISPGFKQNLIEKGVPAAKIHFIPNWVDPEVYHPEEPDPHLAEKLGLANHFNVMFAGNIGEAQGLETVIEAANLLRDMHPIQFVFVGDGVALPRLQRAVRARGLTNVRFLGRYPASAMASLYALADVLLVHLKDDPLFRITIPHKILAYLASGKPILAAIAGDAANMVIQEGAGIACPPSDPPALAAAVHDLYTLDPLDRQRMGQAGLLAVETKYNRLAVVSTIEAVLRSANQGAG